MREKESIIIFVTVKPHIEISYYEQKSDNTNKKIVGTKKLMWKQVCVNTRSVYLFEIIFSHFSHTIIHFPVYSYYMFRLNSGTYNITSSLSLPLSVCLSLYFSLCLSPPLCHIFSPLFFFLLFSSSPLLLFLNLSFPQTSVLLFLQML